MAAGTGVDLVTVSQMYGIPYGTLARWAHAESWPITRARDRHHGLRQQYDFGAVAKAVSARQKRDAA